MAGTLKLKSAFTSKKYEAGRNTIGADGQRVLGTKVCLTGPLVQQWRRSVVALPAGQLPCPWEGSCQVHGFVQ
jgi:hypothetical protein